MADSKAQNPDFDAIVDRAAYGALKFDGDLMASIFGERDLWPSWVADMDFKAAPEIRQALEQRVEHGVYGYESDNRALPEAIAAWHRRHGWSFTPDELVFTHRTLNSLAVLISLFSEEGDGVIVQPPVFYDFKLIIRSSGRRLVKNPLILEDGVYRMDFDQLESLAAESKNRLLILCNPHNPIGRVWSRDDLLRLSEICIRNDVRVIADEIHGDIAYQRPYTPLASVSEEVAINTFTCISPVKSFNLAGVASSMIVIRDEESRKRCRDWFSRFEVNKNNIFTTAAMLAAYTRGEPWLKAVTEYLLGNVQALRDFLRKRIPTVCLIEPEGSYLVWLDFRELGLDARGLEHFLAHEAGIASNPGHWFGREGVGFARINIACPRAVMMNALERLAQAVDRLEQGD